MGTRGLRPRAQAKHRARAPPVPYPPPGWTPARLLGARRPPWSVPLRSLEGDVRRGPAVHARIAGDQLADVLWAAARAAAAAPGGNVERHLWTRLDPDMAERPAAAKLEVKSMYVQEALVACFGAGKGSARAWLAGA